MIKRNSQGLQISIDVISSLWNRYFSDPKLMKEQRFGQFVCNELNITNSKLFYEKNSQAAYDILLDDYMVLCGE